MGCAGVLCLRVFGVQLPAPPPPKKNDPSYV